VPTWSAARSRDFGSGFEGRGHDLPASDFARSFSSDFGTGPLSFLRLDRQPCLDLLGIGDMLAIRPEGRGRPRSGPSSFLGRAVLDRPGGSSPTDTRPFAARAAAPVDIGPVAPGP
jgi:hypothetical protein